MVSHYIKINSATSKEESAFYVRHTCHLCGKEFLLGFDGSRYGQIGSFSCECGAMYHATDLDGYLSPVTIHHNGKKVAELEPYLGD